MNEDQESPSKRWNWRMTIGGLVLLVLSPLVAGGPRVASAAESSVGLGTATPFAVLAGAGVTNTGTTVVNGDLGTCPTPAITGSPTVNGTTHANTAVACKAQDDLTIAYNDAAGREPNATYSGPTDLGGLTLVSGVYKSPTSFAITGTLTLDAKGDSNAVWIFQAGSTLVTAVNSNVLLVNGAQACNVFWQVGSSATLNTRTTFVGTVMALTDISVKNRATVSGRVLARNGAVTLDNNTITRPECVVTTPTGTPTTTTEPPTSTTAPPTSTTVTTAAPEIDLPENPTTTTEKPGAPTTTMVPEVITPTTTNGGWGEDTSGPSDEVTQREPFKVLPRTGSPLGGLLLLAVSVVTLGVGLMTMSSCKRSR